MCKSADKPPGLRGSSLADGTSQSVSDPQLQTDVPLLGLSFLSLRL